MTVTTDFPLSARLRDVRGSAIRDLLTLTARPDVLSLAGGLPAAGALPRERIAAAAERALRAPASVQYGETAGLAGLREVVAAHEAQRLDRPVAAGDVVVTSGSQQALDLLARAVVDPGDPVVVEDPVYVGALQVFQAAGADLHGVPLDADGMDLDALERLLRGGLRPRLVHTVSSFHNPRGVTLAAERRARLAHLADRYGLLVVEDDPYGLLGFEGAPPRAMRADEADAVIYLGSFSKTFAPGLRVGWVLAPHGVRDKLVMASEANQLCPSSFTQMTVAAYLGTHPWREQVKAYREVYRERRDAMLAALTDLMPEGTTWTVPAGGFYVWATLPEGLDAGAMLPRAIGERVAYVPGAAFYAHDSADPAARRSLRLSYCYPTPEQIREGVRRLAGVVEAELEVRASFGLTAPSRGGAGYPEGSEPGLP
jgi:2-aminoadipate transaminase